MSLRHIPFCASFTRVFFCSSKLVRFIYDFSAFVLAVPIAWNYLLQNTLLADFFICSDTTFLETLSFPSHTHHCLSSYLIHFSYNTYSYILYEECIIYIVCVYIRLCYIYIYSWNKSQILIFKIWVLFYLTKLHEDKQGPSLVCL